MPSSKVDNPNLTIVDGGQAKAAGAKASDFVQTGGLEDPFQDAEASEAGEEADIIPASEDGQETGARAATGLMPTSNRVFAPRADRLKQPITPQNAQGLFPPAAALFVAKYVLSLLTMAHFLTLLQSFQPSLR